MSEPLIVDARVTLPSRDIEWKAVRASGPGGQNVNKVSSKVELRFDLAHTDALSADVRARLRSIARNRLDADGRVVIASQKTRDQARNLEDARERLRELVLAALVKPVVRKPTKPSRASRRRRVEDKRKQSEKKQDRKGETW